MRDLIRIVEAGQDMTQTKVAPLSYRPNSSWLYSGQELPEQDGKAAIDSGSVFSVYSMNGVRRELQNKTTQQRGAMIYIVQVALPAQVIFDLSSAACRARLEAISNADLLAKLQAKSVHGHIVFSPQNYPLISYLGKLVAKANFSAIITIEGGGGDVTGVTRLIVTQTIPVTIERKLTIGQAKTMIGDRVVVPHYASRPAAGASGAR